MKQAVSITRGVYNLCITHVLSTCIGNLVLSYECVWVVFPFFFEPRTRLRLVVCFATPVTRRRFLGRTCPQIPGHEVLLCLGLFNSKHLEMLFIPPTSSTTCIVSSSKCSSIVASQRPKQKTGYLRMNAWLSILSFDHFPGMLNVTDPVPGKWM